jgi:hypothetical protein
LISPSYRLELAGGGLEENRSHNKAKEIAEGGSKRRGRREQVSSEKNTSENTKNIYEPTEAIENSNKGVATETGQESQEETVPINSNRRRRGRRGGRRRGRKPLEQTPQDLADGQGIGVASALADDAIQGNENTSINTNTPSQNQKPIPSDNTTTIEKHIADTKTSKLEGKETKKPIKRALTKTLKKTDIKPTAKKRVGNVKSTSASSPKAISDLPPEIAPNTPPKKKPASVTSKLPEDEPKVPLPASAKTQIIQVEADDNMGDDDKKISKGWWR